MKQNFESQQISTKNHSFVLIIAGTVLVTAVVVGFSMYFFLPKLTTITTLSTQNVSDVGSQILQTGNNAYVLSSAVTSVSPLETLNLVFDNQKVFLIQHTQNGETKIELKSIGDYIRGIIKDYEQPSLEPEISLFKNGNVVLIEVLEDTGGMASVGFRTLFVINTNSRAEQKLYVLREGVNTEPILMTFFDKNDLILNCDIAQIEPDPAYRSLDFSNCDGVYFVEGYAKREENLKGKIQTENKGYVYYDKTNNVIERKVLSNKQGQRAIIYTRFSDLMFGKVAIAVGLGEDVPSGGKNRQLFDLSLNP